MAQTDLVFTVAGLQAELNAYGKAKADRSYELAMQYISRARSVRIGLPDQVNSDGKSVTLPSLQYLLDEEKALIEEIKRLGDRRRLIRVGLSENGRKGGSGVQYGG